MSPLTAIILGVVQGLTEFLPVSSSAHLVLAQEFLPGFAQPGILFDVVLHLATTLAVFAYFRGRIIELTRKYFFAIIIATIPTALMGYFFQDFFESLFTNIKLVGITLLVTGVLNFLTDSFHGKKTNFSFLNSILIGISQGIAIVPAISRSGATIFTSTFLGIEKSKAAEFSFLLSIPAILGANLLQFLKYKGDYRIDAVSYSAGFITALVVGFLSIDILMRTLKEKKFKLFGVYCLVLGVLTILLA